MALTLKDLSGFMKHIDICMLATHGARGIIETRPVSNNRDITYKGESYFFTDKKKAIVREITKNPVVNLAYSGHHSFLNRKSVYISVNGRAELITDKAIMRKHWTKDLDVWFKDGIDTSGVTLIRVKAKTIRYWDGWDEGELKIK